MPSQSSGLYEESSVDLPRGTNLVKLLASEITKIRWYFGVSLERKLLW
jgi:hypothetical protein